MSRINSNINADIARRVLTQNNQNLSKSLERLSTGLRINRGSDDPAGLIASEQLRSEKAALSAAIASAERANQITNVMEGGLQEISGLLVEIQGLIGQNGSETGLNQDEKEANQQQVDQLIQTIDRIATTTSFNGLKLLNGRQDFQVQSIDGNVTEYEVRGAKFTDNSSVDVNVVVTQSAQHAGLYFNFGNAAVVNTGGDAPAERFIFELAGAKGTREFTFSSGVTTNNVRDAVNQFVDVTGVAAVTLVSGGDNFIEFKTQNFGSSEFISIELKNVTAGQVGNLEELAGFDENATGTSTPFTALTAAVRDEGQDIGAVINGFTAGGNGLKASVSNDGLDMSVTLDTAVGGAQTLGSLAAFSIIGGGANFNLGPDINIGNQVRIGVPNVAARNLGTVANGFLDELGTGQTLNIVDGNLDMAQVVINDAIKELNTLRGRIGSFQSNVIQSTIRLLSINLENTTAAESILRDTDFATETANLMRNQILVQSTSSALAIANSQPQNILALL